jgi:hypothetical protein
MEDGINPRPGADGSELRSFAGKANRLGRRRDERAPHALREVIPSWALLAAVAWLTHGESRLCWGCGDGSLLD